MKKESKLKLKYAKSISASIMVNIMNFRGIPIQDNYVKLTEWILGVILAGFTVKTVSNIFKK